MILHPWRRLRELGVLGINQRNAGYIQEYNLRRLYPLVDDKLRTKELAITAGIAVPELYGVVETEAQTRRLEEILQGRTDFCIKPAHGSGGQGILVVTGRINERYRKPNGALLTAEELSYYVSHILSGLYSLGGQPDVALIESRVEFDPMFEAVSYLGVPDIRILVFRGVPVMAMVRLPTRMSDGKANLHQGAVGAGVELTTGRTLSGVWTNRVLTRHPDTGAPIEGLQIPQWDRMLELAARCSDLVGLGYIGVDIVLDGTLGPLVLELNARPGLNIQIANLTGLRNRLNRLQAEATIPATPEARVALAKAWFGTDEVEYLPLTAQPKT
jgi:alpha-L-glutamate ligase-like protein